MVQGINGYLLKSSGGRGGRGFDFTAKKKAEEKKNIEIVEDIKPEIKEVIKTEDDVDKIKEKEKKAEKKARQKAKKKENKEEALNNESINLNDKENNNIKFTDT